jgi:hypothetical protein
MEMINTNVFCSAKYERNSKIVYYHYVGPMHTGFGMQTLQAVMRFAESNPVEGIVSDISTMKGTFVNINVFLEKEYYPHMIRHGLKCSAIVLSNDLFTKFGAQDLLKNVGDFQLRMFDNFADAERWVFEKPGVSLD